MKSIRILGTGSYVPPKRLSNVDLEKMGLDTTDEWIVQRTGVKERRMADPDVVTSDLAMEASIKALEMAGLTARDLDLIILATITPDTCWTCGPRPPACRTSPGRIGRFPTPGATRPAASPRARRRRRSRRRERRGRPPPPRARRSRPAPSPSQARRRAR